MEHNRIGLWAKGYLEALMNADEISKSQLETLIEKIRALINENEEPNLANDRSDGTDDLLF